MSQWQPPPAGGADPLFDPDRPAPSFTGLWLVIAGGLAFVVLLACAGGLLWHVSDTRAAIAVRPAESVEEKAAAVRAAFNRPVPDRIPKGIEHLFDEILAACSQNNKQRFLRQIDLDGFIAEMKRSGAMTPPHPWSEGLVRAYARQILDVPRNWERCKLVYVDSRGRREAIVYGYFWEEDGSEWRIRWWIARDDEGWKVFDWELLQFGTRWSNRVAIYYTHRTDPALEEYWILRTRLEEATRRFLQGEYQEARRIVREAERTQVPPPLLDDTWREIGLAWVTVGCSPEARAAYQRISAPDEVPDVLLGLAIAFEGQEDYERALQYASRYEELLGQGPAINATKGRLLLSLYRAAQAVPDLRKSLDIDPDQPDVLQSLGHALEYDEKHLLADYVRRTVDPAETCISLAANFAAYSEPRVVAALTKLLAELEPGSPRRLYLEALGKEAEADYAAAAVLLEKAVRQAADPDQKQQYANRALEARIYAGQPVEGYLAAHDPIAAFEYLVECYESGDYDLPPEEMRRLVDTHRRQHPHDPRGPYAAGQLLEEEQNYDAALEAFAAAADLAEKQHDEGLLEWIRLRQRGVLASAGKVLEAYRAEPTRDMFSELASSYRWMEPTSDEACAELKSLIDAHRREHPDDPWLVYYQAIVAEYEKNFDRADKLLARAAQLLVASDEYAARDCSRRRIELAASQGRGLELLADRDEVDKLPAALQPHALLEEDDRDRAMSDRMRELRARLGLDTQQLPGFATRAEIFEQLASYYESNEDFEELERLMAYYQLTDRNSSALRAVQVRHLWRQKNYERLVELLEPWLNEPAQETDRLQKTEVALQLVRAHLRLGRPDRALAAATRIYESHGDPCPLVLVHAAQNDATRTGEYLKQLAPLRNKVDLLYRDEDVGEALLSPPLLSVRRLVPPSLESGFWWRSAVLLQKEAQPLEAGRLREALGELVGPDAEVFELPDRQPGVEASFVIRGARGVCCVSAGKGRYGGEEAPAEMEDADLREALAGHKAWWEISVYASPQPNNEGWPLARRAAAALADENLAAVYLAYEGRLLPNDAEVCRALNAEPEVTEIERLGASAWLFHASADESDWREGVRRRLSLPEFAAQAGRRGEGEEFLVRVELRAGVAVERHWLVVDEVLRGNHGYLQFNCRFPADSRLVPHYRAGEPIAVTAYQILETKRLPAPTPAAQPR